MGCGGSKEEDSAGGRQQASVQQKYAAPPEVPAKAALSNSATVVASSPKPVVAQLPSVQSDNYGANAEDTLMKVRALRFALSLLQLMNILLQPPSFLLAGECRRASVALTLCSPADQHTDAEVCRGAQRAHDAGAGPAAGAGPRGRRLPCQLRQVRALLHTHTTRVSTHMQLPIALLPLCCMALN